MKVTIPIVINCNADTCGSCDRLHIDFSRGWCMLFNHALELSGKKSEAINTTVNPDFYCDPFRCKECRDMGTIE